MLAGVVARLGNKHHVRIQRLGHIVIDAVGKGLFVGGDQAFHHHHFGTAVLYVLFNPGDNFFQQHVQVATGNHAFGIGQRKGLRWRDIGAVGDHRRGVILNLAALARLGYRFEKSDVDPVALHGADHAEADRGGTNTAADGDEHYGSGHETLLLLSGM